MANWLAPLRGWSQAVDTGICDAPDTTPSSNRVRPEASSDRTSEDLSRTLAGIEAAIEAIAEGDPMDFSASQWRAVGLVHDEAVLALVAEPGWCDDRANG